MNEETQSCDSYKAEYKRNETSGDTGCSQWAKQGRISPYLDLKCYNKVVTEVANKI